MQMADQNTELRYQDLKQDICKHIYLGTYADGSHIPSERQLALDYCVSRITVRKALELLEEEKLIRREVGNGTIVQYRNWGNSTALDVLALVAPSKNPFFASFIAHFQKIAWEQGALLLYVEVPESSSLEDCLFRLYQRDIRNAVVWPDDQGLQSEKLLRLRSIGMNLVFFDTDDGFPYGDCVYLDNREAIRKLLSAYHLRRSMTEGAHMLRREYRRRHGEDYKDAIIIVQAARFENGTVRDVVIAIRKHAAINCVL